MFQREIAAMQMQSKNQVVQQFYSPAQLARALGIGTTKLYQLFKLEDFPKPTSNPHFNNKYNIAEVQAWINGQWTGNQEDLEAYAPLLLTNTKR